MSKWHWVRHGREWRLQNEEGEAVLQTAAHRQYLECYQCEQEVRGGQPESWLLNNGGNLDPESEDARLIALAPEMLRLLEVISEAQWIDLGHDMNTLLIFADDLKDLMERAHGRAS
jgi:hypothetical protein